MEQQQISLLMKALYFASHMHRDQRRKDREASPYINHPVDLANILVNEANIVDIEILCAALLHDTIEDTRTTENDLIQEFGDNIAALVLECTDDKSLPKVVRKQLQIDHAKHLSTKAKAVKIADKISNLRDVIKSPPSNWSLERRQQYFDWAKDVIDGLRGDWKHLEDIFDQVYLNKPLNLT